MAAVVVASGEGGDVPARPRQLHLDLGRRVLRRGAVRVPHHHGGRALPRDEYALDADRVNVQVVLVPSPRKSTLPIRSASAAAPALRPRSQAELHSGEHHQRELRGVVAAQLERVVHYDRIRILDGPGDWEGGRG